MKKKITLTLIVFYQVLLLFGQYESKLKIDTGRISMRIEVNNNDFCFACPIPFNIELKATKSIVVFDLNTGHLGFKLNRKKEKDVTYKYYSESAIGGWYRNTTYITSDSIYETIFEEIEQTKIELRSNESCIKECDIIDLFHLFPDPGEYSLDAAYEGQIKSNQKFRVVIDYQKSISNILNMLDSNQTLNGVSSLSMFYYLTGYKSWNDSITYQYNKHFKEAPKLRIWWQENKDVITKVESTLKLNQYQNLNYLNEVPNLIKSLQSNDYQERLLSHKKLIEITGIHDLKISPQDNNSDIKKVIDEVQQWWENNKKLITWVNRIILETLR